MAEQILYDPQIRVNNETFLVVPESVKLKTGRGESLLKPQSSGNGEVTMVYSENIETKVSGLTLDVYATADKIDKILELKDNKYNNYVSLNSSQLNIILKNCILANDPEMTFSSDGKATLEFMADPIR